jgi:hypothetical protein
VLATQAITSRSGGRTAREREVLQLLRDYRAFHSAFGGAIPPEESYITTAEYHSGPDIEAGAYWPESVREIARETYKLLDHALDALYAEGTQGRLLYLLLLSPYLGAEADPAIADRWRARSENLAADLDLAIFKLAHYLRHQDLFVVFPSRMTSGQDREIERRNSELFQVYTQLRSEGRRKTESVETAADMCGYSVRRAWAIVKAREV